MINETLQKIQSKLKAPKSQRNTFGNYNYRSCEDILEAIKPLLAEDKATIVVSDEMVLLGNRFYVKATATLRVGEETISATGYAREEETKKGMDASQITGASSSYARKYALNGLFAIDDTKDSDATNTGDSEPKEQPKPVQKAKTNMNSPLNGKEGMMTFDQVNEFTGYGYTIAQLVTKLNKPTDQITQEEMETVLEKIRRNRNGN